MCVCLKLASPPFRVFIAVAPPLSTDPSSAASPIETLFTTPTSGPGFDAFGNTVTRIALPLEPLVVDSKIGWCGKRGCVGCDTKCGETFRMRTQSPDYEIFREVLRLWQSTGSAGGVVIVKSTTVTASATSDNLAAALEMARASEPSLDVFFFSKWLDRPEQFRRLGEPLFGGGHVVRTWNPHGFQALALTPSGMQKLADAFPPDSNPVVCRTFSQVINSMIQQGGLVAATTTPSLLQYDAMLVGLRELSSPDAPFGYLKTAECMGAIHPEKPLNRRISADLSLFWAVLIIFVAVVAGLIMVNVGAFALS